MVTSRILLKTPHKTILLGIVAWYAFHWSR